MHLLAISGSLRAASSNTALLLAARELAPESVDVAVYDRLADLPHFNPDVEEAALPKAAADLRTQVAQADGLLISSPEYAHGIPGSLKNALDWLVGSAEFAGMPVALISASPWSVHAPARLTEILTTMAAQVVPEASISVPLLGRKLDANGIVSDPEISSVLRSAVAALVCAIDSRRVAALSIS